VVSTHVWIFLKPKSRFYFSRNEFFVRKKTNLRNKLA
jgi:hypothetical protein